jgi:hypothetical protein
MVQEFILRRSFYNWLFVTGYIHMQFVWGLIAGMIVGLVMEWVIDWSSILPRKPGHKQAAAKPRTESSRVVASTGSEGVEALQDIHNKTPLDKD